MRLRLIFAVMVTAVAGLVYCTPLDMRDGRDLPAHGLEVTTAAAMSNDTTPEVTTTAVPTTTTTTVSQPKPIITPPAPEGARCPQWWHLAQLAGWTYDDLEAAVDLIMWRESRCIPDARSSTSDTGLMQINDIHLEMLAGHDITGEMLADPWWNLVASRIVSEQAVSYGWSRFAPWAATYP